MWIRPRHNRDYGGEAAGTWPVLDLSKTWMLLETQLAWRKVVCLGIFHHPVPFFLSFRVCGLAGVRRMKVYVYDLPCNDGVACRSVCSFHRLEQGDYARR